jgi:hypothetical protein
VKYLTGAMLMVGFAAPGLAQENAVPPPDFYQGQYRMIGVAPDGAVDENLRLDMAGDGLAVSICGVTDGGQLRLPKGTEEDPYVDGTIKGRAVICEAFWTFENYPLLACYGADGARLTLWPQGDFGAALECAN